MAQATFKFEGLDQLMKTLDRAGQIAADGSRNIVRQTAVRFQEQVKADTKIGKTGNLRRGIKLKEDARSSDIVGFLVVNTAPHAHLYEYGFMHARKRQHIEGKFVFAKAGGARQQMNQQLEKIVPQIIQAEINKV